jgi:hypothetical protein
VAGPTTFGLFGTLVAVDPRVDRPRRSTADATPDRGSGRPCASGAAGDRGVGPPPDDGWSPAAAVAEELAARGVEVPGDWTAAYAEPHLDPPPSAVRWAC